MGRPRTTRRHRWLAIVIGAYTSVSGGCSQPPAPTARVATGGTLDVRVMTFNIRYGTADDGDDRWPNRRELVFEVIRTHRPDVVGLQEALDFQLREILDAVPPLDSVGVGRADGATGGEYCAILFRRERFRRDEHGTFWLSDTPDVAGSKSFGNSIERICTWVRLIDRNTGAAFYVYNLHLDHRSQPSRERGVELLAGRISSRTHDDPFVITGDFNAAPDNPAIATLLGGTSARSLGVVDCFRESNEPSGSEGTFNGFRGTNDGARIDYIFTRQDVTTRSTRILHDHDGARYPSDHFPVLAELTFRHEDGSSD